MGFTSRGGLAEFNEAGCGLELKPRAVLGNVRSAHMQIVNPGWDVAGSHVSASVLERTSAMAARGLSRMCHLPQDVLLCSYESSAAEY